MGFFLCFIGIAICIYEASFRYTHAKQFEQHCVLTAIKLDMHASFLPITLSLDYPFCIVSSSDILWERRGCESQAINDVMVLGGLRVRLYWEWAQYASTYSECVLQMSNNKALLSQAHIHHFPKMINRSRNVQL